MRIQNYGIYHQGALITDDDFDTLKLIIYFIKAMNLTVSEIALKNIKERQFSIETAKELCDVFGVKFPGGSEQLGYDFIRDELLTEVDDLFLVDDNEPSPLNTAHVYAVREVDLEGEFIFEGDEEGEELDGYAKMLAFSVPYVWNTNDYKGPKTKQEAIEMLQEAAKTLLYDNIDWGKRLGVMIASGWSD